jgi:hypothetical protein
LWEQENDADAIVVKQWQSKYQGCAPLQDAPGLRYKFMLFLRVLSTPWEVCLADDLSCASDLHRRCHLCGGRSAVHADPPAT